MSPNQFFNSDAEAIQAATGAYETCYWLFGSRTTYDLGYWSDVGTDISGAVNDTYTQIFSTYTMSAMNDAGLPQMWSTLYKGVVNTNLVIANVKNNQKLSGTIRAEVLGQALFLRALYYYWLTCLWGDVPMWLEPLNFSEVGGQVSRTPVVDIRTQMVADLTEAYENLPEVWTGNNRGRASKWAAGLLLCRVYLWQQDWAKTASLAKEIINNRDNGGQHRLRDDYGDIWGIANEYNAEKIWEIDFTANTHSQSFTDRYTPNSSAEPQVPGYTFTGFGMITSTPEFIKTFEEGDLRKKWYNWNGAGGVTTTRHYVEKHIEWGEPRDNHGGNATVYRLADAYLIFAEARNELSGPDNEAYESLNIIRRRAGLEPLGGLSQGEFRQAVRTERSHELGFEFNRRWDLNRWGLLVEAVKRTASNPTGAANIKPFHVLCPIPSREIALNPALTQNSGY